MNMKKIERIEAEINDLNHEMAIKREELEELSIRRMNAIMED